MAGSEFASPELALCFDKIERCIDRIVELLVGCADQAAVSPPVPGANSLATIVSHVIGNVSENILGTVGGELFERDRDAEFAIEPSVSDLLALWEGLRPRLRAVAASIPTSALFEPRPHPRRGEISVLEVFLVVLRHMGEHEGHAQLTSDWLAAGR
ncbi:MAG: DinB family protein [Hyphomicrobium sp.]|nr:DinB family protein [Hyphomicrobium sp.]